MTSPSKALTPRNEVEIIELCHRRRRAGTTGPTYGELTLHLFVATPPGDGPPPALYVFDRIHFEPIHDDLGTLLSSADFADYADYQRTRQQVFGVHRRGDGDAARQGPVLELYLKLPARHASTIPRLSGTIEIASVRREALVVEDLVKAVGKPIDSPLLVGLEVTPFLRKEKGNTLVSLRVAGNRVRFQGWGLVKGGEDFGYYSPEPDRPVEGGVELNYSLHRGKKSDGLGMQLNVFVADALHRCEFDLKDIELP